MIEFLHWLAKTGFSVFMQLAQLLLDYLEVLVWPIAVLILVRTFKLPIVGMLSRLREWSGWGGSAKFAEEANDLRRDSEYVAAQIEEASIATETEEATIADTDVEEEASSPSVAPAASSDADEDSLYEERLAASRAARSHLIRPTPEQVYKKAFSSEVGKLINRRFHSGLAYPAVLDAWEALDTAARRAGQAAGMSTGMYSTAVGAVVFQLANRKLISPDTPEIAFRLEQLYSTIMRTSDSDLHISTTALLDFVDSARNLTRILDTVRDRLDRKEPRTPDSEGDDPDADTPK